MKNNIYQINKGINRSITFKGLKAQYIWYMGAVMFVLLIIYALMYLANVHTLISLVVIVCLGAVLFTLVYHLSAVYGEHGLSKAFAARNIPSVIKSYSRKSFYPKHKQ
ncbi:DUF4133 domain-containing protein [Dyadobacter psychrotolerans]|uniref:DUF4133 domain-containing protein n=1 Tax=Dyadobacter psychrotolerans TaxID=2541721 RepID=A0A4R5DAP6_9BACT|nr:DUF4133 domain-containing protein [Dyadobacter psychrotolerans]TDE10722.1 DUF4133 domain-containing protein [Dyadobacter psychrotolerans]